MPCCAGHLLNYCVFSGDKRFVGLGDLNLLKKNRINKIVLEHYSSSVFRLCAQEYVLTLRKATSDYSGSFYVKRGGKNF